MASIDTTLPSATSRGGLLARYLQEQFRTNAFVSMISAHVARGRRNLGAGMIHLMRQVGIDAFQTILLPGLDRDRVKIPDHDTAPVASSPSSFGIDSRMTFERYLRLHPDVPISPVPSPSPGPRGLRQSRLDSPFAALTAKTHRLRLDSPSPSQGRGGRGVRGVPAQATAT